MARSAFELSATELDVLWRAAGHGDLPLIIDVPSPGKTYAERAEIERRVWTDLRQRGIAEAPEHADWRLAELLGIVAQRRRSLQLRVFGQDAINAMLAVRGRHVALAVLGSRFRIRRFPDTGLAATLLSLLPPTDPGYGHSVNVPAAGYERAARASDPAKAHDLLRRHGLSGDDARTLLTMTNDTGRVAQVVVEQRNGNGSSRRSAAVSIHDTPRGRYRTIRRGEHLTVTPVGFATLVAAVDQLDAAAR